MRAAHVRSMRHLNGRVGAQGKETEDTEDQQHNANNEHGCVFRFATDHVGVLQDALQAVGMGVAHQWCEGNGGDGRESHLTNPKNPLLALDIWLPRPVSNVSSKIHINMYHNTPRVRKYVCKNVHYIAGQKKMRP